MVGLMHALQHLHVAIVCCIMRRCVAMSRSFMVVKGLVAIVLHSQTTWHQLMQALQHLGIVRVRVMLRVMLHYVLIITFVF